MNIIIYSRHYTPLYIKKNYSIGVSW